MPFFAVGIVLLVQIRSFALLDARARFTTGGLTLYPWT